MSCPFLPASVTVGQVIHFVAMLALHVCFLIAGAAITYLAYLVVKICLIDWQAKRARKFFKNKSGHYEIIP